MERYWYWNPYILSQTSLIFNGVSQSLGKIVRGKVYIYNSPRWRITYIEERDFIKQMRNHQAHAREITKEEFELLKIYED